jgi:hypothetical protein
MFKLDWTTFLDIDNRSTLNSEPNWEDFYVFSQEINKHALPITITK